MAGNSSPSSSGSGSGASASTAQLGGTPQLGYVWDASAQAVDPMLGVAGASRLGQPVTAAGEYVTAEGSIASGVVLAQDKAGNLNVISLTGAGSPAAIAQGIVGTVSVRFARSGGYAVAFVAGTKQAWLVQGLPSSPSASAVSPSGAVADAAVSDAGKLLLAEQSGTHIAIVNAGGTAVASLGGAGGIAFLHGTDNAIFADRVAGTLTLANTVSTNPQSKTISVPASTLLAPSALEASLDGHFAVAANSAESSAVRIDLTGVLPAIKFSVPAQPVRVAPLAGNAAFALTTAGSSPVWITDASADVPSALFIPARAQAGTGGGQ